MIKGKLQTWTECLLHIYSKGFLPLILKDMLQISKKKVHIPLEIWVTMINTSQSNNQKHRNYNKRQLNQ